MLGDDVVCAEFILVLRERSILKKYGLYYVLVMAEEDYFLLSVSSTAVCQLLGISPP